MVLLLQHQVMGNMYQWVVTAGQGSSSNIHCPCHMLKMPFLTAKLYTFVLLLSQVINGKQRKLGQRTIAPGCHTWLGLAASSSCHSFTSFFATFQVSCPSYSCCVTHELLGSYLLFPLQSGLLFLPIPHTASLPLLSPVLFICLMLFS